MKSQTCSFVDEVRTLRETKWLQIPQRCKYIMTLSEKENMLTSICEFEEEDTTILPWLDFLFSVLQ